MNDPGLWERINTLSAEEETLYTQAGDGSGLAESEIARLQELKVELDQCYDLLRQREARRAAGLNPDEAEPRPAEVVEHYQQ